MKINGIVKYEDYLNGVSDGKKYSSRCYIEFICKCCNNLVRKQLRVFKNNCLCGKCSARLTNLERYGVDYPSQNKEIHDKQVNTFKDHYSDPEFKSNLIEKKRRTKLERYGDPRFNNIEKCKRTKLEKYGNPNYTNFDKIKETIIKRYGGLGTASETIKEKCKATMLERYGDSNYGINHAREIAIENAGPVGSRPEVREKIKDTMLRKYGYEHNWQIPEAIEKIKEKVKKVNLEKYGVTNVLQVSWIIAKSRKKYYFDNTYFDSSWELAYYIWLKDNNIPFEYHTRKIKYTVEGRDHFYFPDFIVNGELVEIKGPQFFKDGKFIDFYNNSSQTVFDEKWKCMMENKVTVITDVSIQLKYILEKYGKDYMKQFKEKEIKSV